MKAIIVRYLPATNHKPARYKVFAEGSAARIVSAHDERYRAAYNGEFSVHLLAQEYALGLHWVSELGLSHGTQRLVRGTLPGGDDVFVMME